MTEQLAGQADPKQNPAVNSAADSGGPSTAKPLRSGKRTKSQPQAEGRRQKDLIATITIAIDLREDVLRAAEEPQSREEKFIELPSSRATLLFHLPDGSDRGVYEIKIVDPFGSPLKRAKGFSHDGKTLHVLLDLRDMSEAKYRLCLSRKGEVPDCYQVLITNDPVKR
ncbi:MAG TPA: hypothetical protein VNI02_06410 [Blastocatellia bacterium]|nr:hypothetical protein [Blastocatellia bacterium]